MQVYSCKTVEQFIENLVGAGYEHIQLSEGVLGIGDSVLLSNDPNKYNYLIREKYLNEWSSGQTVRRFITMSKKLKLEIENA